MQASNTTKITTYKNNIIGFLTIILLVVVPMIILWIYGGEFNLSHNNWLVASYGKGWGTISEDGTIGFGVNIGNIVTSYQPYIIGLAILIFANLVYILFIYLRITKISNFNFLNGIWLMCFGILISGLIYPKTDKDLSWVIIVRALIAIAGFIIGFFISNIIVNKFLIKTKLGQEYGFNILREEKESSEYINKNIIPLKHDLKQNKKKTQIKVNQTKKDKEKKNKK